MELSEREWLAIRRLLLERYGFVRWDRRTRAADLKVMMRLERRRAEEFGEDWFANWRELEKG